LGESGKEDRQGEAMIALCPSPRRLFSPVVRVLVAATLMVLATGFGGVVAYVPLHLSDGSASLDYGYDRLAYGYDLTEVPRAATAKGLSSEILPYDAAANLVQPRKSMFAPILAAKGGSGGARFVVSSTGETRVLLKNGLEVTEHAGKRMVQKGIPLDEIDSAVLNNAPFNYFHQGAWKTGYYDRGLNLFVGSVNGKVTTVFRPDRGVDYIKDLQAASP
jgi:hypothetical protein